MTKVPLLVGHFPMLRAAILLWVKRYHHSQHVGADLFPAWKVRERLGKSTTLEVSVEQRLQTIEAEVYLDGQYALQLLLLQD